MDKKSLIAMGVLFVLLVGYQLFLEKVIWPKHPEWSHGPVATQPSTPAGGSTTSSGNASGTTPTLSALPATDVLPSTMPTATMPSTSPSVSLQVAGADQGIGLLVGSDQPKDPDFPLGLHLTPDGAALQSVIINEAKSVNELHLYTYQEAYDNDWRALGTRTITVNGQSVDLSSVKWALESSSPASPATTSATFGVNVYGANSLPMLHVSKTYHVAPRGPKKDRDKTAAGYEVSVTYHLTDLANVPETVRLAFNGPTMPPREAERQDDRLVIAGYDKGDQTVEVARVTPSELKPGNEQKDLSHSDKGNKFLWAGTSSLYFAAVVRDETPGQIDTVHAVALNPQDLPEERKIALNFETTDLKLTAGSSVDVPLDVFMGPKRRDMLEGEYYSAFPRGYSALLVNNASFCGICAFPWLIDGIIKLLGILQWIFHDWGLAIIVLVIIVRLLLHPISKSSQVSMMKMQKMGPEFERLKKKYGDDKEGFTKAQMQLYKEMGFMPFLGCLPMFLQMPIWFALYSALQNEFELRQAPFLWGWTWIHDLARPDRLISFDAHAFTIPLIGLKIAALNVLPLLMAVVFFMQQKYTPKPPTTTPEQATQQKMMQWMTLLFPLFLYSAPSGLNLYILTSTGMGVLESKRIRDHIKQKEEDEKNQRVTVETKQTRQGKLSKKQEQLSKEKTKPGLIAGWWAKLQERAEEIRRNAEKKK